MVTTAFDEMDELVYGIDWYLCPIELQKYLMVMLAVMRQPIFIKGIFSLDSTRFTFKRVNFYTVKFSILDFTMLASHLYLVDKGARD